MKKKQANEHKMNTHKTLENEKKKIGDDLLPPTEIRLMENLWMCLMFNQLHEREIKTKSAKRSDTTKMGFVRGARAHTRTRQMNRKRCLLATRWPIAKI